MTARCTWDPDTGWIDPETTRPCAETHCAMRGRCANHVDPDAGIRTCPACIGRTRRDLATIDALYAADLEAEVTEDGVESEAMNLLGAVAPPGGYDSRRGFCQWPRDRDTHPYAVLGGWDLALRETYGPATELRITVPRAVAYLDNLLAGPFPHGDEFEEFAADVARCRAHLEQVVHLSRRPEEGRPCPECVTDPPRLVKRYDDADTTGAGDRWVCSSDPAHTWTEYDYRARVAADYVAHAPLLTAHGIAERFGVPVSTVRKLCASTWADGERVPPRLESTGTSPDRRKLYPVTEAERLLRPERNAS